MYRKICCLLVVGQLIHLGYAQQSTGDGLDRYLEDQFYIGLGINFLGNRPNDVVQSSLSYSLQLGFIKDIPLNEARNFGIGLGLGYAANSYYSNIGADRITGEIQYRILDSDEFTRNKLETHTVELPFEIRWRTSTATDYKFWRIYTGLKVGYVFSGRSKLVSDMESISFSNNDFQDFQYGLTLNFGYNTWNLQAYYGLNPLLKSGTVLNTGESIEANVLRVGIIFYIL